MLALGIGPGYNHRRAPWHGAEGRFETVGDIDRGRFLRGLFGNVLPYNHVQKIGCRHLAWLAMRDKVARNAAELADSAREAGFSVEVYPFHASFVVLVTAEEGVSLVSFTLDSDGVVLTESKYYPEDLVSSEREVSREYFERLMDWYTSPSTTL